MARAKQYGGIVEIKASRTKRTALGLILATITAFSTFGRAGGFAPLRPEILSAKTVAIQGGPPAVLDKVYADLKKWGRFEVVSDPSQADLVFEVTYGMTRAPRTARVSVYNPDTDSTSYGTATTPGVWSEQLNIEDGKTRETLYQDGRAGSPGLVTLLSHYSMARAMMGDLRKRIEASEALATVQYTQEFETRAAHFFADAATFDHELAASGKETAVDTLTAKAAQYGAFANQLRQESSQLATEIPNLTLDALSKKQHVEEINKNLDGILAYTCAQVALEKKIGDLSRQSLSPDVLQTLNSVEGGEAALAGDCSSERAANLLKQPKQ